MTNKRQRRHRIGYISLLVCLLLACRLFSRPEPRYGLDYNDAREQAGVPVLPADWEVWTVHSSECTWVNPERVARRDARVPVHWSKYVNYRTGELIYETDTYFGSEDYMLKGEGTFREKVRMTYYYQVDDYDYQQRLGWSISYQGPEAPFGQDLTLEQAEAILRAWDILQPAEGSTD